MGILQVNIRAKSHIDDLENSISIHLLRSQSKVIAKIYDKFLKRAVPIYRIPNVKAFYFKSWLAIDVDGAPNAFHPVDRHKKYPQKLEKSLAYISTAGSEGHWWALATHNNKPSGKPVIQQSSGPGYAPGYFVSKTTLYDEDKPHTDQRAYVNSNEIPYIALPKNLNDYFKSNKDLKVSPGDFATVYNIKTDKLAYAIFADLGPNNVLGEGSIALSRELGLEDKPPNWGSDDASIVYVVFPNSGSGPKRLRTRIEIDENGSRLFEEFGGLEKLRSIGVIQ